MESILLYFLQVNVALVVLYAAYRLLFQRDTFFRMRRFTLLGIYLIAFLYPLPDLSQWMSSQEGITEVVSYYSALIPTEKASATVTQQPDATWNSSLPLWIAGIYLVGFFALLLRCLVEITLLVRTRQLSNRCEQDGITYYRLYQPEAPYSFFGWIFMHPEMLGEKASTDEILTHESTHVQGWHSLDVLIGEIVCILCWINPFAWWLKQEVTLNHEYIADEAVMLAGYDKKMYQYHLIGMEHPPLAAAKLYNHFSVLPLKKRITMLNKKRTNSLRRTKYLLLLPLALGLLFMSNMNATARRLIEQIPAVMPAVVTQSVEEVVADVLPQQDDKIHTVVDVQPMFPGGDKAMMDFLNKNIKYPKEAEDKGISGRVIVTYIVEKDGSLSDVTVVRSLDPLLDQEAIRVMKLMPKWTPGKDKGKVVRTKYTLPFTFRLSTTPTPPPPPPAK